MKRSHNQSATIHHKIKGLGQKSKSLENRRDLPCVDIDKVMAKYDKDSNNEEPLNQKSKLEILASQKSKFHQIFSQKFKYEKFSSKMTKSPNNRTYYSREDSTWLKVLISYLSCPAVCKGWRYHQEEMMSPRILWSIIWLRWQGNRLIIGNFLVLILLLFIILPDFCTFWQG